MPYKQRPRVTELNERKREALQLRLNGMTYREIGKRLGVSQQRAQQLIQAPKAIRIYVSTKANFQCEICGISLTGGHIHHKLATGMELEDHNDVDNLQYLCISCHRKVHTGTIHRVKHI